MSPGPNARPVSYSFEKPDLLQKTSPSPAPYINNPIISSQQMNNDGSETTNLSGIYLLCQKIDMTKNSSLQMAKVLSLAYSRLRNKHRATLINFWNFFPGATSLLKRAIHKKSPKFCYLMKWDMFFLRGYVYCFSKWSRGYAYSRL